MPIWNINGFAEQFLRLLPRYHTEFRESCRRARQDRDVLFEALRTIPGVTIYAPRGNFVFMGLPDDCNAHEIACRLLADHNILVKDCSQKIAAEDGQYLRIASLSVAETRA